MTAPGKRALWKQWVLRTGTPPSQAEVLERALRDERNKVWQELKNIADAAAKENRCFTPAETAIWDRGNATLDAIDIRLAALHRILRVSRLRPGEWQITWDWVEVS